MQGHLDLHNSGHMLHNTLKVPSQLWDKLQAGSIPERLWDDELSKGSMGGWDTRSCQMKSQQMWHVTQSKGHGCSNPLKMVQMAFFLPKYGLIHWNACKSGDQEGVALTCWPKHILDVYIFRHRTWSLSLNVTDVLERTQMIWTPSRGCQAVVF